MDPNGPFIDGLPSYHGLPWFTRVYLLKMAVSSAAMLNYQMLHPMPREAKQANLSTIKGDLH